MAYSQERAGRQERKPLLVPCQDEKHSHEPRGVHAEVESGTETPEALEYSPAMAIGRSLSAARVAAQVGAAFLDPKRGIHPA